ncbi:hypothetical protein [Kaistia defluvii]|uniref:DNA cytosine methyltransferase n=1 Tax=Kaistia defluvii TaxID=410841 RepID=A0ABV2R649_9HYPH
MASPMRVLVGCEYSGIFRRAFAALGHDAWSNDLLPAEDGSNRHLVGDIREYLGWDWDLLVVAHPPCTRLCRSGRRWLSGAGKMTPPKSLPKGRTWPSMIEEFEIGVDLFLACWNAPVPRVAIENPEMHDLARARMPVDLPRPQMVQPHWFGHPEFKATGWYLRGLPGLVATEQLALPDKDSPEWKAWNRVHRMPPGPERWKERSRSFPGMATASARQWTQHVETERAAA